MAQRGRPRKPIDEKQVEELAAIQCSYAEIAAVVGCDPSTLTRNFAQAIEKGRERGKSSLKRAQYKAAMDGNSTMLVWLGKQHLGQADKMDSKVEHSGSVEHVSQEQREAAILGLLKSAKQRKERGLVS